MPMLVPNLALAGSLACVTWLISQTPTDSRAAWVLWKASGLYGFSALACALTTERSRWVAHAGSNWSTRITCLCYCIAAGASLAFEISVFGGAQVQLIPLWLTLSWPLAGLAILGAVWIETPARRPGIAPYGYRAAAALHSILTVRLLSAG